MRSGDNRVGTLNMFGRSVDAKRRVLTWRKMERGAGIYANHPKIKGEVYSLDNSGSIELVFFGWWGLRERIRGLVHVCRYLLEKENKGAALQGQSAAPFTERSRA